MAVNIPTRALIPIAMIDTVIQVLNKCPLIELRAILMFSINVEFI